MRNVNCNVFTGPYITNAAGIQIDTSQLCSVSFQVSSDSTASTGIVFIVASNDPCSFGNIAYNFTVQNWVEIPDVLFSITNGASAISGTITNCYRWLQVIYYPEGNVTQTIATVADVAGSLNSTYFFLQDVFFSSAWYVWFSVNSAGVDPNIPGRIGVQVNLSTNASANTVATAVSTAIGGLGSFVASSLLNVVTLTTISAGSIIPISDGLVPTHFTFAYQDQSNSNVYVNMNALGF